MSKGSERRRHYRVLDFQDLISAELAHKQRNLSGFAIKLVDISSGGAGLSAPATIRRKLSLGDRVLLKIRSARILKPLQIEGELLHISKGNQTVRLSIAFDNWVRDRKNLDHSLLRIFNEREAYRVQPQGRINVTVQPNDEGEPFEAELRDLCIQGLGLRLKPEYSARLAVEDEIQISFRFTEPPRFLVESPASVRWLKDHGSKKLQTMGLSLRYDPRAEPQLSRVLTQYVMSRQRDMRRRGLQEG